MLNTFRLGAAMEHRAEEGALGQDSCISANMCVISLLTHVYSMFLQKYRYRTQTLGTTQKYIQIDNFI